MKRILRYVKGTINHDIVFIETTTLSLTCFSDADWAVNPDDRQSTSCYYVLQGNNLISLSAKKRPTVAKSSTKFEYRSLAHSTTELPWILYILKDFHISIPQTPIIWCHYMGALLLASNPIFHARTKHIDVD